MEIAQLLIILLGDPTVQRRFLKISYMYGLTWAPVPDDYISILRKIIL